MHPLPLLMINVTLPLLLGGCGEKEVAEPVAKIKAVEDKVQAEDLGFLESFYSLSASEWVFYLIMLGLLSIPVMTCYYSIAIYRFNNRTLEKRGFLMRIKETDELYEGERSYVYEDGQLQSKEIWKNGMENGLFEGWYKSGIKEYEENYKEGKLDGISKIWHEGGQKDWQGIFKEGKKNGLFEEWHKNGLKMSKEIYKNDKLDGPAIYWYENGLKKSEMTMKRDKVVKGSEKYWNSKGEPLDSLEEVDEN